MIEILGVVFGIAMMKACERMGEGIAEGAWALIRKGWSLEQCEKAYAEALQEAVTQTITQAEDEQATRQTLAVLGERTEDSQATANYVISLVFMAGSPDLASLTELCLDHMKRKSYQDAFQNLPTPDVATATLERFIDQIRANLSAPESPYAELMRGLRTDHYQAEMLRFQRLQYEIIRRAHTIEDEATYRAQIIELHRDLQFTGLTAREQEQRPITIEDVFIPLRAERSISRGVTQTDAVRTLHSETAEESAKALIEAGARFAKVEMVRVALFDILPDTPHIVILGDPGAGKTTFLKFLAVVCASGRADEVGFEDDNQLLPIFVPLHGFAAEASTRDEDYNLLDYFVTYTHENLQVRVSYAFFEDALKAGRCVVCLDGLDEVWQTGKRRMIDDAIRALAAKYPNNRYFITSRIAGYAEAPLDSRSFIHYTLTNLEDEDIHEFVSKWYTVREPDAKRREDGIRNLIDAIEGEARIRDLARNPLLLTIIAIVHRAEAKLPDRRVVLYERCVDVLLDAWDSVKGLTVEDKRRPYYEKRSRLLERLAYSLHAEAEKLGEPQEISRGDLEVRLTRFIMENRGLPFADDPDGARTEACAMIALVQKRTGLLIERGENVFAFPHLTFQEYLTAMDIKNRHIYNLERMWKDEVKSHLLDPHWREVILLLLGSFYTFDETPATYLVERILEIGKIDKYESVLHRHLYMAARALGDKVNVSRDLKELIVDELFAIILNRPTWEWPDVFIALSWQRDDAYVRDRMLDLTDGQSVATWTQDITPKIVGQSVEFKLSDSITIGYTVENTNGLADLWIRWTIAHTFQKLNFTKQAGDALLALAHDTDANYLVRKSAVAALGQLGIAEMSDALLALMHDSNENPSVRGAAAGALGRLGLTDEAGTALLTLMHDSNENPSVRNDAALAMGQLGRTDEAGTVLLDLARDTNIDPSVRGTAALALGQWGRFDEAGDALSDLAHNTDIDPYVRSVVVLVGRLSHVADEKSAALLAMARDTDIDPSLRFSVAFALERLDFTDEAGNMLLAMARDTNIDPSVRIAAVAALEQLDRTDEEAGNMLLAMARDTNIDPSVRSYAALALGQLDLTDEASSALLALTRDTDANHLVRRSAAAALGQLGRTEEVGDALLALARDTDANHLVRRSAVAALGQLGRTKEAGDALLALAHDPGVHPSTRRAAYDTLKKLFGDIVVD